MKVENNTLKYLQEITKKSTPPISVKYRVYYEVVEIVFVYAII